MLVEVDWATNELCVELTPGAGPPLRSVRAAEAGRPVAFVFTGLHPGTKYVVDVTDASDARVGAPLVHVASAFRTQPAGGPLAAARIGVVSCNKIYVTEKHAREDAQFADAWVALQQRVERGELDVLLHLGDQVHLQTPHPKPLHRSPPTQPDTRCTSTTSTTWQRQEEQSASTRASSCTPTSRPKAKFQTLHFFVYSRAWS